MLRITFLYPALIAGLSLLPAPLFAQDQPQGHEDAKSAESSKIIGKKSHPSQQPQARAPQAIASRQAQSSGKIGNSSSQKLVQSNSVAMRSNSTSTRGAQQTSRSQSSGRQTQSFAVQGNQANHYDGHWFAASSHSDWDRQTDHQWRNHDYRWYNGGWLLIDTGYGPGYDGYGPGYSMNGSTGSNVQASLARLGYYAGPIDGHIGNGTRSAIAHYESDNGLRVNGVIDEPLLVSLRLE